MKLTEREIEALKGIRENEKRHADSCLGVGRVGVLSKIIKHFEAENEPGTTNDDKPFEPGEIITFSGEKYRVIKNLGDSGYISEYGYCQNAFRFRWTFEGEQCRRVKS